MGTAGKSKKGASKKKSGSAGGKRKSLSSRDGQSGGLSSDIAQLRREEDLKQREEKMRKRLNALLQEESRFTERNSHKVDQVWRRLMRHIKTEDMKKEIEILSQTHERQVDRKNAMIQVLLRDVDEVEEQYNLAFRSHLIVLDELLSLQEARIAALSAEFEKDVATLQNEFESERADILAWHEKEKDEINSFMNAMRKEAEDLDDEARQEFQSQQEELRNKNSEDYNMLKITLELNVDEYQNRITEENNKYIAATHEKFEDYKMLVKKDKATAKKIEQQLRNIQRLQESLSHWRAKLNNNIRECQMRNKALREEKDMMAAHFKALKGRMNKIREQEHRRLIELVMNAKECDAYLSEQIELGEKVVKFGELCRKYETEREKILPFIPVRPDEELEAAVRRLAQESAEKDAQSEALQQQYGMLERFYRRYNKVLLDKLAIQKERERLIEENQKLRDLLKQYLDGITVNAEVMAQENPLMIVRPSQIATVTLQGDPGAHRSFRAQMPVQREYVTVVEGNAQVRTGAVRV